MFFPAGVACRPRSDRSTAGATTPLQLLVQNIGYYKTYTVTYDGGPRFPHLVRDERKADLLEEIIMPRATTGTR